MRLCRWCILLVLLLVMAESASANGNAWTRKRGGYYLKVGLTSLTATEGFGYDGNRWPIFGDTANFGGGDFGVTDVAIHGEYGITEWLTGVASTQYKVAVRQGLYRPTGRDSTASASGLGDLWLGARLKLLPDEEPFVATVTLGWKLPTGSPLQDIPLGTGVIDYEAIVAVGTTFPAFSTMFGYAQLTSGYRLRNTAGNEVSFMAEAGLNLSKELMVQGIIDGRYSTADFDPAINNPDNPEVLGELKNDQSFTRWKLGLVYSTGEEMDLHLGYEKYAGGRNIVAGSGIAIGISWHRR